MKTFDTRWEEVHSEREWGRYPSEDVIRFVARNYYKRDRENTRILDMGCGAGTVTWYLAREGFDAYAYDGSKSAVERAKKRLQEEGVSAKITVADAADLKYESDFFDAIIDSAVICANTDKGIRSILRECYRVLKNGGKIFSSGLFKVGMTGYGLGEKLEDNTYREITEGPLAHIGTIHFFDRDQIIEYWESAGFQNIRIDSLDRTDYNGSIKISYYMVEGQKT